MHGIDGRELETERSSVTAPAPYLRSDTQGAVDGDRTASTSYCRPVPRRQLAHAVATS
ncbi:hypothetical protein FRAHR75_630002 [Frankia sp. Hr75.2]|nr:hypothetical protein FRAHR75_630002 [Frankia sp. Hr75.2]